MELKNIKLVKTKRKTVELKIGVHGNLSVRAPLEYDECDIDRLVYEKRYWIKRKQKEMARREKLNVKKEFVNGEGFLYLGKLYKLYIIDNNKTSLTFDKDFYLSRKLLKQANKVFINWYTKKAKEKIEERVKYHAPLISKKHKRINITNAKKRWGSCGECGSLNFSWRLIMAPLSVVDYIVVHELVHLQEKSHSREFWNKVRLIIPNYEQSKQWLRENEYLLNFKYKEKYELR